MLKKDISKTGVTVIYILSISTYISYYILKIQHYDI